MPQPRMRVFVSFDLDHDRVLRDFIIAQSRRPDSPFHVVGVSTKPTAPQEDGEADATARIQQADALIVMVGTDTHHAPNVQKEVKIAHEEGKPVHQIIGYSALSPKPVAWAGPLLRWNWNDVKQLLVP